MAFGDRKVKLLGERCPKTIEGRTCGRAATHLGICVRCWLGQTAQQRRNHIWNWEHGCENVDDEALAGIAALEAHANRGSFAALEEFLAKH